MCSWRWLIGVIICEVDEKGNYLDQLGLGQETSVSVMPGTLLLWHAFGIP